MMKTHKRKKSSRIRGARTCGWGFRQKHKGPGNRGGVGMAGSGKRADHKKQVIAEAVTKGNYFGKQGATSRGTKRDKQKRMNLIDIKENIFKKSGDRIDLKKYIILGNGEGFKAEITAKGASASAIEKMEKAGGKIILPTKTKKTAAADVAVKKVIEKKVEPKEVKEEKKSVVKEVKKEKPAKKAVAKTKKE